MRNCVGFQDDNECGSQPVIHRCLARRRTTQYLFKDDAVKPLSFFGFLKLTRFSKPSQDRVVYQLIKKNQYQSFVEVGLGDGTRCAKMVQAAMTVSPDANLRYTGIDLFDARDESQTPIKLIDMHKQMKGLPAKTQLVPGELDAAVQRIANSHLRTDLMLISAPLDEEKLQAVVPFMPRMLHSDSVVLLQREIDGPFEQLNRLDIERMAAQTNNHDKRDQKAKAA